MKENNLIHVGMEYEEALAHKKTLLSVEVNLLRVMMAMEKYNSLRKKEISLKTALSGKIRSFVSGVKSLQNALPKQKTPKTETAEKGSQSFREKSELSRNNSIEEELKSIQAKLRLMNQSSV